MASPAVAPDAPPEAEGALADAGFHALARVATATAAQGVSPFDQDDDDDKRPAVADDTPAARLRARDRHDFADARFNRELLAEEGMALPDDALDSSALADGESQAEATPEFLRRAEQRARWNRPAVVVAMASLCIALLLGLAAQAAHHFRDLAAATWPATRPTLEALCDQLGCRIEPVRRINDIVIESSALTGAPEGDAVRLSVVLRNRGALPLAVPAIELTLTDVGGQMLARRALLPAEFGLKGATLPAASETPLQLVLGVSGRRPSGYTVEPFYP